MEIDLMDGLPLLHKRADDSNQMADLLFRDA
jgi:hypothetical protein